MTFHEYQIQVHLSRPAEQRLGQYAFNLLYKYEPGLATIITGNLSLDPFYVDDRLPAFWAFVEEHWSNP